MRYGTLLRRMRRVASTGGVIAATFRGAGSIVGDSTLGSPVEARAVSMATRLTPPMVSSLPPVFVPQFVGCGSRLAHHPTGPDRPRGSTDVLPGDGVLLVG